MPSYSNPTGLRGGPARRMAPYKRTKGLIRAVHPDGFVTKPNTNNTISPAARSSGKGSVSLSRHTGGKKQVVDTGAQDQGEMHKRDVRKGLANKNIIVRKPGKLRANEH